MVDELPDRLSRALSDRYRLQGEIGAGGMAVVYLAEDLRHGRRVALKVLHPDLAAILGAERFLNEIRVTAKLQHPNVLPLFDSGEASGLLYYVMPYVEGESLRERLESDRELPIPTAVAIAREVASALDYAHRHGVVHRDIKPGNILLQDGRAMVADFGIALAVQRAGGDRLTQTGLSLGTPEYMSPEQASGDRPVDARSDVYSLGAVLYEMLAGQPPFTGPTVQSVIAQILTGTPKPLTDLRATAPVRVVGAVERALARLPADRFETAADFASVLEPRPGDLPRPESVGQPRPSPGPGTRIGAWLLALVAIGALFLVGMAFGRRTVEVPSGEGVTSHLLIDLPDGWSAAPADLSSVAISPDGRRIVFVAGDGTREQLFLREMGSLAIQPLPGSTGALGPFFSPDGTSVGFFADGQLKRLALGGGAPVSLADAALARGAAWGGDGSILFTSAPGTGLWRVPARGGRPELLTALDLGRDERTHRFPRFVRGTDRVFFTIRRGTQPSFADAEVALLSLDTDEHEIVLEGGAQPTPLPTGHLVFARGGILQAVRLDPDDLLPASEPTAVVDGVVYDPSTGAAQFDVSDNGTLVYLEGGAWAARRALLLASPDGARRQLVTEPEAFRTPRFSPDGRRIAVVVEAANDDIWIHDLATGTSQRLTFAAGSNIAPLWSPDGGMLVFASNREGRYNLFLKDATGSGAPDRLTSSEAIQFPTSWHPSGNAVLYTELDTEAGAEIRVVGLEGHASELVIGSPHNEQGGAFSPDGGWIAYVSDESGRNEIYLQRYPATGGKQQVSTDGGLQPRWSPDGSTLYYRGGSQILAVEVRTEPTVSLSAPRVVVDGNFDIGSINSVAPYDVNPAGGGFLLAGTDQSRPPDRIHVVINWFAELRRQLPGEPD